MFSIGSLTRRGTDLDTTPTSPKPTEGLVGKKIAPLDKPDHGAQSQRPVTLRLVATEADADCNFWVGLARKGDNIPSGLMEGDIPSILAKAAAEGLTEEGPLMLSDSLQTPPRYIYLLPVPDENFREQTQWIKNLVDTIQSWSPESAGFYFAPELLSSRHCHQLLSQILRQLILASNTSSFYLLIGSHGMNAVLNNALRLRSELIKDSVNLYVFH